MKEEIVVGGKLYQVEETESSRCSLTRFDEKQGIWIKLSFTEEESPEEELLERLKENFLARIWAKEEPENG